MDSNIADAPFDVIDILLVTGADPNAVDTGYCLSSWVVPSEDILHQHHRIRDSYVMDKMRHC